MSDQDAPTLDGPIALFPERLGPCRLVRPVGSGGMATVYLAEMLEDRPYAAERSAVAIKVLDRQSFAGTDAVPRFLREAEMGRGVRHPAVVRTYETGRADSGGHTVHFLVLEYVEGQPLSHLMTELGVVPEVLLRHVAQQVAEGLAALHAAGIVHRDVKPSNILLTPAHDVKLTDLGIALPSASGNERLTSGRLFVGTPLYASPEQLSGLEVTPASDLYSLGVVLYEAVTGHQPFAGGDVQDVMRRHLSVKPPRVDYFNPQVSPFFEEVVACLLEKEPRARLSSAALLAAVLEAGDKSPWWHEREGKTGSASSRRQRRTIRVSRETPLVGRDPELETLTASFAEVLEGRGRAVLIDGEAGVGKTRLLDELLRQLRGEGEDLHVLYGSHPPGGVGRTRGALAEAVVTQLGEAGLEAKIAPYLTATPRLVPAFAAYLTGTPAPEGEALSHEALHALFCHLARSLAAERPVIWIVEDLHFGSVEARALLLSLARMAHDQRLLLIATTRPGLASDEIGYLDRMETTKRISLGRLSPRQVIDLLRQALGSERLAEQLGGRIAAKSDGNPYFILEILRELKERDSLRRMPDGSYMAGDRVDRLTVPSSVRDLLLGHLKDLPLEHRALLDVGAVIGFGFDPDLVARVREMKRLHVLEALAGIERRYGVVRATGSGFQFDHHQLQEVLYAALPPMLRVEYHALLAEAYETRGAFGQRPAEDVPGDGTVFLAEHFLKGERRNAGLRYVLPGLDHLAALYRNEAFLELADLALVALGTADAMLRCDVRLRQAECLDLLGRRDAQKEAAEDAFAAAESAGDTRRAARARLAMGGAEYGVAHYERSLALLLDAERRAVGGADPEVEIQATGLSGNVLRFLGRHEEAGECHRRQLDRAQAVGRRREEAIALCDLAVDLLLKGRPDEARAHLEHSAAVARAIGFRKGEANAVGSLGHVFLALGPYGKGREAFETWLSLSRDIGYRHSEAVALGNLGRIALNEGRLEEAEERIRACLGLCKELQQRHVEGYLLLYLGDLSRARSEADRAEHFYAASLELCRDLKAQSVLAEAACGLGRHFFEHGRLDLAAALFEEAEELSKRHSLALPGPLPGAYLSLLGRRDHRSVVIDSGTPIPDRAEAHYVLYRAGAARENLDEGMRLLEQMSAHIDPLAREAFWRLNPTAKSVRAEVMRLERPLLS